MPSLLQTDVVKIYSVSEVTRDIRLLFEDNFPSVWISGEVSNFRTASSGHVYFTLKDRVSRIPAVMFRVAANHTRFQLEDGLEIIVHGRISVYEQRGQYQIIVDHAEPKGLGALQLAFNQLKKRLEAEGIFDPRFKKPIPYLPKKVGIVTSPGGAVLHDMLTILKRRFPNIEILVNPVRVQGDGSATEIAQAIAEMNGQKTADVIIVGRGGGSMEDLWAFNEEVVVRAIFASEIPVISAVGHETDFTLADFAADLRAPTPSSAAELAVPEKKDLVCLVSRHKAGLQFAFAGCVDGKRGEMALLKKGLKDPKKILEDLALKIDDRAGRLLLAVKTALTAARHGFREKWLKLESLSPTTLLKKGFSLVFREGTRYPLKSKEGLVGGDVLEIQLYDGKLKAEVV